MEKTGYHQPVLAPEAAAFLVWNPSGVYADCTLGGGGHSEQILKCLDDHGRIIGIDRDPEAIAFSRKRLAESGDNIRFFQSAFGDIDRVVHESGEAALDGLLLDLGVSSHQIDSAARGFSYLQDGPLDMRMDPELNMTASDVIQSYSESALADLFFYYGEERRSRQIARLIAAARDKETISTTGRLTALVRSRIPDHMANKTLARIFQSLRIEVNSELKQLETVLVKGGELLKSGGRMVVISYHSLEDRLVKRFFRNEPLSFIRQDMVEALGPKTFRMLHKKVVRAGEDECRTNPRARSARLRAAEKLQAV